MKFDWEKFLLREFKKGKLIKGSNGRELNIDCISDECPNPKRHMFINLGSKDPKHDKKFVCKRCSFSGNHVAFLMAYFKLPYEEITKNIIELYGEEASHFDIAKKNAKLVKKNETLSYSIDSKENSFKIDIPEKSLHLTKANAYLKKRDIEDHLIKKANVMICKHGFYKGRLIFPIKTNNNESFLAYSQLSKESLKKYKRLKEKYPNVRTFDDKSKKTRNPFGSLNSKLLYNYNNLKQREQLVFVQEGVFDVLRTISHGYKAVGIFSKSLSDYQANLLSDKNIIEICVMLDSDADKNEIRTIFNKLKDRCDSIISFVRLEGGDPDDIRQRKEFIKIIKTRRINLFF